MRIPAAIVRLLHASNIKSTINSAIDTLTGRACNGNPYCENVNGTDVWSNDCGIEKPSAEGFNRDRDEMLEFFGRYFNEYVPHYINETLQKDEPTLPAFMAKRLAPNISPSAVICDGRSKCQIPSCDDFGKRLSQRERQIAWYMFEFFSILDHAQRAMYDGTNEFFDILSLDVKDFVAKFTYADEQQTIAQMKEQHRKMILALIMSMTLLVCAAISGMTLMPVVGGGAAIGGIIGHQFATSAAQVAAIDRLVKPLISWTTTAGKIKGLDPVAGLINNGYIGLQNLAVTFDPVKDTKGFDKLVDAVKQSLAEMQEASLRQLATEYAELMTGGTTRNQLSLLDLFAMGQYQVPTRSMTQDITDLMKAYYYAMAIKLLWQREGTYIVETQVKDGKTCVQDDRGHNRNRICLHERPDMVYWIYSVGLDNEKTITSPPGFGLLAGRTGYKGFFLEDVIRSSLWIEEKWAFQKGSNGTHDSTGIMNALIQPLPKVDHYPTMEDVQGALGNSTSTPSGLLLNPLDDYGTVLGTFAFPICRSWSGFAISSVNIEDSANAPCICDDFQSRSWTWHNPVMGSLNGTSRFVKHTKLYNNRKYGRMCLEEHKCKKQNTWCERLDVAKEEDCAVEDAWMTCEKTFDHDKIGRQRE